jgi:hypothetical protein
MRAIFTIANCPGLVSIPRYSKKYAHRIAEEVQKKI